MTPRLPCCEHGYMTPLGDGDVECCICSRSFCDGALADRGERIRAHLFAESERNAWFRDNPQPNPFEVTSGKPRLLDLFCCAGGAGKGYADAGFEVVGVDIHPQPRYPFEFHQGDALAFLAAHGHEFDVIHASPPCQAYTPLGALHPHIEYPDLVAATRDALRAVDRPYVMENVMAAPLLKAGSITLCGGMFGLRTYRHRRFEPSIPLVAPEHPKHVIRTATKRRRELWDQGWHVSITGDVGVYVGPEALGIDWMSGNELCQAIPPAYTHHIGEQFLRALTERPAA